MTKIEKIEQEIRELSRGEFAAFREWFYNHDSGEWDKRIEEDAEAGRLDDMARKALAAHRAGRTKEL